MKKTYLFLLMVLILAIFSCTIPKEIEVRGSASKLKFGASFNFGEMLTEMITESFSKSDDVEKIEIIECSANTKTFIVYMELFDENLDASLAGISEINSLTPGSLTTTTTQHNVVNNFVKAIDLSGLSEYLDGFEFTEIESRLYVSGCEFVKYLTVDIDIGGDSIAANGDPLSDFGANGESGFDEIEWSDKTTCPKDGKSLDLGDYINNAEDLNINYSIYIPGGTTVYGNDLVGSKNIKAELVIWIPMKLKAVDIKGAELKFPKDSFSEIGDFIESVSDYVESMTIEVIMSSNPFHEGSIVMKQPGTNFSISNPLKSSSLIFKVSPSEMRKIIDYGSDFKPEVSIKFDNGKIITIQKDIAATHVSFSAQISYMVMED